MEIRMGSLLRGAQEAQGTTIIIDVYRAFTTASIAFTRGAEKIILVAEVEKALDLRNRGIGEICVGEIGGMRPEGFDFGNSPFELSKADIYGKTLIQSTRAGTVGVVAATNSTQIYAGSLVIAETTANSILNDKPELVSIVAMGVEGKERADEDEQCALYLRNLLQGRQSDPKAIKSLILSGAESQKYDDPLQPQFNIEDRTIALQINSLPLAIKVSMENGLLTARPKSTNNR